MALAEAANGNKSSATFNLVSAIKDNKNHARAHDKMNLKAPKKEAVAGNVDVKL